MNPSRNYSGKYNFEKELSGIRDLSAYEQIKFFQRRILEYTRDRAGLYDPSEYGLDVSYPLQCREHIKLMEYDTQNDKQPSQGKYKMTQKQIDDGDKIDLIRVLAAWYYSDKVYDQNGLRPELEKFMIDAGNFFGVDLSNFHKNLSQALQKLDPNLIIFDSLKEEIKNEYLRRLKKK